MHSIVTEIGALVIVTRSWTQDMPKRKRDETKSGAVDKASFLRKAEELSFTVEVLYALCFLVR